MDIHNKVVNVLFIFHMCMRLSAVAPATLSTVPSKTQVLSSPPPVVRTTSTSATNNVALTDTVKPIAEVTTQTSMDTTLADITKSTQTVAGTTQASAVKTTTVIGTDKSAKAVYDSYPDYQDFSVLQVPRLDDNTNNTGVAALIDNNDTVDNTSDNSTTMSDGGTTFNTTATTETKSTIELTTSAPTTATTADLSATTSSPALSTAAPASTLSTTPSTTEAKSVTTLGTTVSTMTGTHVVSTAGLDVSTSKALAVTTITGVKITTSTMGTNTTEDKETTKEMSSDECDKKMFSGIGLLVFIGVSCLCFLLMLVLLGTILCLTAQRRHGNQLREEEKNMPRLKMLELRETGSAVKPRGAAQQHGGGAGTADDGLQTYSLDYDYERHVQAKIEEHRRKTLRDKDRQHTSPEPVSTFQVGKKASIMSVSSTASTAAPGSPTSPGGPDSEPPPPPAPLDEDNAQVFNFSRTPGESLVARRASNLENTDRRRSSLTGSKPGKALLSTCDEYDV